jgi:hypothetical protein
MIDLQRFEGQYLTVQDMGIDLGDMIMFSLLDDTRV